MQRALSAYFLRISRTGSATRGLVIVERGGMKSLFNKITLCSSEFCIEQSRNRIRILLTILCCPASIF